MQIVGGKGVSGARTVLLVGSFTRAAQEGHEYTEFARRTIAIDIVDDVVFPGSPISIWSSV